jgi:hypothetical protein
MIEPNTVTCLCRPVYSDYDAPLYARLEQLTDTMLSFGTSKPTYKYVLCRHAHKYVVRGLTRLNNITIIRSTTF